MAAGRNRSQPHPLKHAEIEISTFVSCKKTWISVTIVDTTLDVVTNRLFKFAMQGPIGYNFILRIYNCLVK